MDPNNIVSFVLDVSACLRSISRVSMIISITIAVDTITKLLYHQVRSRLLAVQFSVLTTKN